MSWTKAKTKTKRFFLACVPQRNQGYKRVTVYWDVPIIKATVTETALQPNSRLPEEFRHDSILILYLQERHIPHRTIAVSEEGLHLSPKGEI